MADPYKIFGAIALTGGTKGCLDKYKIGDVIEGARAVVILDTKPHFFVFDSTATDAEDTATRPFAVRPDNFSTVGVWKEVTDYPVSVSDVATHAAIAAAHHARYTNAEAVTAAKTVKLDDLTAPDDTGDLDASAALHGLMSKAYAGKLDGIEAGAEVNNISDVNATDLTDGGDTTLHDHDGISENTGARHTQGTDTALGAVGTKNPPIDADKAIYRDSTASDALVTSTWTQVKAFLKTYFDGLYNNYTHPNHSGDVTSVADGAQTIANKQTLSATSPITLSNTPTVVAGAAPVIAIPAATNLVPGHATAAHIGAIEANTTKNTNVSTALSVGTVGVSTVAITSDGGADDVIIPAATNAAAGVATAAHITALEMNTLFNRHTLEAGESLTVAAGEQKLVGDTFTLNSTAFITLNGSGELCVV